MEFSGSHYNKEIDEARLERQIDRVLRVLQQNGWLTVTDIANKTGDPENSIQAQIRNLRKAKNGGFIIDATRATKTGLFKYKLVGRNENKELPKHGPLRQRISELEEENKNLKQRLKDIANEK